MALTCSYQQEHALVTVTCTGRLSDRHLLHWHKRLAKYVPPQARRKLLVDCMGLTDVSGLTPLGLCEFARGIRQQPWAGVAIVVAQNVTCGLANQLLAYTGNQHGSVGCFRELEQAQHMLGIPSPAPRGIPSLPLGGGRPRQRYQRWYGMRGGATESRAPVACCRLSS